MAKIYYVETPREALELALKFKKSKKFNLFRGQNEDWPLVASINRLSSSKRKKAVDKLLAFKLFLSKYKFSEEYVDNLDYMMAIGQHYGIPTDFIDFTYSPEIATFFATHSNKDLAGKNGVIFCVNKEDFKSTIEFFNIIFEEKGLISPYIFEPKINNLWRLQAQCGCFLQLMFGGIENLYEFDKIIFPHNNEVPGNICVADIYPKNKSDLEIILDNYFAAVNINEGAKRIEKFAKDINMRITKIPKQKVYEYVKSRKIHKSWKIQNTKSWKYGVQAPLSRLKNIEFILQVKCKGDLDKDIEHIEIQLSSIFKELIITNKRSIAPIINFTPALRSSKLLSLINKNVRRMWDGMRTLPYTRRQILYSISKYLVLEFYDSVKKVDIESLFYSPILISMSDSFGTHCRCLTSRLCLQSAIREDILDIQSNSLPKSISTDLLLYVQKTNIVFDFDELVSLFYYEIIPSQMIQSKHSCKPTLFFSPIYVDRLGYA